MHIKKWKTEIKNTYQTLFLYAYDEAHKDSLNYLTK